MMPEQLVGNATEALAKAEMLVAKTVEIAGKKLATNFRSKTMLIRFIQDYGDIKSGTIRNTHNDEDAETLISSGIAEKYIATDNSDIEKEELEKHKQQMDEIVTQIKKQLKTESKGMKFVADNQDKKFNFEDKGFFHSVLTKNMDVIGKYLSFVKATGNTEGVDSEGGYLVPEDVSLAIMEGMTNTSSVARLCTDTPINNSIKRPYVSDFDKSSSWYGGIATYWLGEGVAPTISKLKFGKYRLELHKLGAYLAGTEELLADSLIGFEQLVTVGASYALSKEFDEQIINGTGAAMPLGIMNSNCLIEVAKETDQDADTILTENIIKMRKRASNYSRSVWLINEDCYDQLLTLTINVGTGGAPVMLFNMRDADVDRLLRRPIVWCEHCQTLGTTGDIILADLSQYNTASKAGSPGVQAASSIHVKFLEGEQVFRFIIRIDGQPMWYSDLTPKHGSVTKSPFVKLAER